MKSFFCKPIPQLVAIALMSLAAFASYASGSLFGQSKIDFEYTGQVLDIDTEEPIEGAFVLAVYEKVDLGFAASARYCVKTKGMTTGNDGRFHFPIDKLDGNSPSEVVAIKADYFFRRTEAVSQDLWKKQNKDTYSNRNVYLKKQDPTNLQFRYGYTTCGRPESREAVEANIQFLKIGRSELMRLAGHFDWYRSQIETNDSMIDYLLSETDVSKRVTK